MPIILDQDFAGPWLDPKAEVAITLVVFGNILPGDLAARGMQPSGICAFLSFSPTDTLTRLPSLACDLQAEFLNNNHKLFYCNEISLKEMLLQHYPTEQSVIMELFYICTKIWLPLAVCGDQARDI